MNARKEKSLARLARLAAAERARRLEMFANACVEKRCDCNWPDEGEDGVIPGTSCAAREALGMEPAAEHQRSRESLDRLIEINKAGGA